MRGPQVSQLLALHLNQFTKQRGVTVAGGRGRRYGERRRWGRYQVLKVHTGLSSRRSQRSASLYGGLGPGRKLAAASATEVRRHDCSRSRSRQMFGSRTESEVGQFVSATVGAGFSALNIV